MKSLALALAAAVTLALAPALAGTPIPETNRDGMISLAELRAIFPEVTDEAFADADIDGDGLLTPEELKVNQVSGDLPS